MTSAPTDIYSKPALSSEFCKHSLNVHLKTSKQNFTNRWLILVVTFNHYKHVLIYSGGLLNEKTSEKPKKNYTHTHTQTDIIM